MAERRRSTLGRVVNTTGWARVVDELRADRRQAVVDADSETQLLEAARRLKATEDVLDSIERQAREEAPVRAVSNTEVV